MAKKKKSRKSRKTRRQVTPSARQPKPQVQEPESAQPIAAAPQNKPAAKQAEATLDFVKEYAYVYHDLRETFLLAGAIFVLIVVVNLILTQVLVA